MTQLAQRNYCPASGGVSFLPQLSYNYLMPNYLIDTHCHLHAADCFTPNQQAEFLQTAAMQNVQQIICIGTDHDNSLQAQTFAHAHSGVFWTYGIHPEYASAHSSLDLSAIAQSLRSATKLVAIGEIGLDYHYDGYNHSAQIRLFEQMLQLARDLDLPISLHLREAFTDAWPVLDNFSGLSGVVHSFTGSKKDLKQALARDFYIGVNGLATYTTPALPPLEKMLLETDAPFLTPVPFRGTINQPAYVHQIATYLANKLGVAEVNIAEQTTKNARQLFKLGDAVLCEGAGL